MSQVTSLPWPPEALQSLRPRKVEQSAPREKESN